MLKLADKTINLRTVPQVHLPIGHKRRIEYVEFARKVAAGLKGVNESLEEQFEEAAQAAERSFKPAI